MLLPEFVPEVFLRIQFRGIRWQEQQAQIVGQAEVFAFVPAGAIKDHDDVVVWVAAGDLVEEDLHAIEIDMWQHQTVEGAVLEADRAIGVGILLRHHGMDERPGRATAPAVAGVRDATETCLVLEHQPQRPAVVPARYDLAQVPLEFFFQSSRAEGFPCG